MEYVLYHIYPPIPGILLQDHTCLTALGIYPRKSVRMVNGSIPAVYALLMERVIVSLFIIIRTMMLPGR
jgi:hypothetical protein